MCQLQSQTKAKIPCANGQQIVLLSLHSSKGKNKQKTIVEEESKKERAENNNKNENKLGNWQEKWESKQLPRPRISHLNAFICLSMKFTFH